MNAKVAYAGQRLWYDRGRLLALVAVVVVLAVTAVVGVKVLTHSGGQPQGAVGPPVATPSPTPDPVKAEIIQGYKNATAAFVHAATTSNPNDPALAATAIGVELVTETTNVQSDVARHIISRGDIKIGHSHVDSISPVPGTPRSTAQLTDCRVGDLHAYDPQTGLPVNAQTGATLSPGQTPHAEYELVVATLGGPLDGVWKVLDEKVTVVASCPAI